MFELLDNGRALVPAFIDVPQDQIVSYANLLHHFEFDPSKRPTLATMTQAGGGVRPYLIAVFHEKSKAAGKRFFVMYGETEPRLAFPMYPG